VSVSYATADGTAKAGSDYTAQAGSLVFAPGVTTRTIAITVFGDKIDEADESFSVKLSGATNAVIADALAVGTILDNDDAAKVENQMYGFGSIVDGRLRDRFVFRVADRIKGDYARLEFWSSEPVKGKGVDDDDRDGCLDKDYRRDHKAAKNRFESTSLTSLVFGPRVNTNQTVSFSGAGTWNGKAGYTFEAHAADRGEPGRGRDTFTLVVKDSRGTVVFRVDDTIDDGNIQSKPTSRR
jgi:hypothetical protein